MEIRCQLYSSLPPSQPYHKWFVDQLSKKCLVVVYVTVSSLKFHFQVSDSICGHSTNNKGINCPIHLSIKWRFDFSKNIFSSYHYQSHRTPFTRITTPATDHLRTLSNLHWTIGDRNFTSASLRFSIYDFWTWYTSTPYMIFTDGPAYRSRYFLYLGYHLFSMTLEEWNRPLSCSIQKVESQSCEELWYLWFLLPVMDT